MISGKLDNNINQKSNIPYGAIKDVMPNNINSKLPENLQNLDAQQIANNNGAIATTQNISKESALLTLPIYASFVALRSLNDAKKGPFRFTGEYEKTILGKLSKAGDAITKGFRKLIPDKIEFGISDKIKSAKNWVLDHSAIARSWTTPIRYENRMAMSEANGLFGRVMSDNAIMFEKGFKGELKDLRKLFGADTKIWKLLKEKGIESLGGAEHAKEARELVAKTLREIGEKPVKSSEVQEYVKEIIKNFSKSDQEILIDSWGRFPIGKIPILRKIFNLRVPASEISNKLRTSAGISGAELAEGGAKAVGVTALGRGLASGFAKTYEGFTSDFVGGKIAPIMQAYFIASAALKAKDAPKGQKLATFMDEETGAVSFLFTMPLATSLLAKAGGMKYIGMGANKAAQGEAVSKFREMIASLNSKIDAGSITRGEYVEEVKNIKNVLKGKTRFWQKPFKALGKLIGSNYERETIKPFIEETIPEGASKLKALGINASNKVQTLLYKFKSGNNPLHMTPGGVLRFALVMFVLSPILSKPIKKLVNKIFGKPYEPDKKDKKTKKQKGAENNPFANITDEEMMNLLVKNQSRMAQVQNDPKLMQELQSDPNKLYEFLKQGEAEYDKAAQSAPPSPLLQQYKNNIQNQAQYVQPIVQPAMVQPSHQNIVTPQQNLNLAQNNFNPNTTMPAPSVQQPQYQAQTQAPQAQRNYIPSSSVSENVLKSHNANNAKLGAIIKDMDKTEKEFSKYINI